MADEIPYVGDGESLAANFNPPPDGSTRVDANQYTDDHLAAPYMEYTLVGEFTTDSGVTGVPIAGRSGACRVVRLSAPTATVTYTWSARRKGAWPILPSPEPPDDNHVLQWKKVMPHTPHFDETGRVILGCGGIYQFILLEPIDETVGYPTVVLPWTQIPIEDVGTVPPMTFKKGLFGSLVELASLSIDPEALLVKLQATV